MNLSDYIPEIRCPFCFSYISINQSKENSKINIYCENCGKKEFQFEEFYSLLYKNNIKSCNYCCKNYHIKELLFNTKYNNFFCKNCFINLKKAQQIEDESFTNFNKIDQNCNIHKENIKSYFCLKCDKHICSLCLTEHSSHNVLNICEEAKKKNNIEELKLMVKKEEEEIEREQKLGELLINSMTKIFDKEIKNRNDILDFKKQFFLYFTINSNNYITYQNAEFLLNKINNSELFVNDYFLNQIEKLLNSFDINNNLNNINNNKNNIIINNNNKTGSKTLNQNNQNKLDNLNQNNEVKNCSIIPQITRKPAMSERKMSKKITKYDLSLSNYIPTKMPNIYLKYNDNKTNNNNNTNNNNVNNTNNNKNNNEKKHGIFLGVRSPIKQNNKIKLIHYDKKEKLKQIGRAHV
mgnify:CR=1 FL=1